MATNHTTLHEFLILFSVVSEQNNPDISVHILNHTVKQV